MYKFVHGKCYDLHISNVQAHLKRSLPEDTINLATGEQEAAQRLQSAVALCTMDQCIYDEVGAQVEEVYAFLEDKYLAPLDTGYNAFFPRVDCMDFD